MSTILLLLRKDLLVLRRSPLLLGMLVAYPVLIAVLVGLVAIYANSKPRVALVDEAGLPAKIVLAGHTFNVDKTIGRASRDVSLIKLSHRAAEDELANGKVVAVVTVPPGFLTDLRGMLHSPKLVLQIAHGGISSRVGEQVQALVYGLNRQLQIAYIGTDLGYVRLIQHGGQGSFLGREFTVLGLDGAALLLRNASGARASKLRDFIGDAQLALARTGDALRATAHPIEIARVKGRGRTWALSADVQAYALGLTISFLALVLAAGSLAAERDENVVGRLARGLVTLGELVWAKVLLAAVVALALGLGVSLVFGAIIEIGNVTGGEPWGRVPLLAVGLLLAGAALGALGSLLGAVAREARTASLVALLVVLPIVFLGLVPQEIVPAAGWISDGLPFIHGVRFFSAALYDASPWWRLLREALWLCGLGAFFGILARFGTRRLLA